MKKHSSGKGRGLGKDCLTGNSSFYLGSNRLHREAEAQNREGGTWSTCNIQSFTL